MNIDCLKVGPLETNCYILSLNEKSILIDPGADFQLIKAKIKNELIGVLLTHSHFDHIGALDNLKDYYNIPVYSFFNIKDEMINIDELKIMVIKNPGHSMDSISFVIEDKIFCGDFIFKGTIGRTDLPTGSMDEMQKSLNKILDLNKNYILYPGHGEMTTLDIERRNLEQFL